MCAIEHFRFVYRFSVARCRARMAVHVADYEYMAYMAVKPQNETRLNEEITRFLSWGDHKGR